MTNTDESPTADAGLSITEEYALDDVQADEVRIGTLAELLAIPMTHGTDAETRVKDLCQIARYAGFTEQEVAAAQTKAKRGTGGLADD